MLGDSPPQRRDPTVLTRLALRLGRGPPSMPRSFIPPSRGPEIAGPPIKPSSPSEAEYKPLLVPGSPIYREPLPTRGGIPHARVPRLHPPSWSRLVTRCCPRGPRTVLQSRVRGQEGRLPGL